MSRSGYDGDCDGWALIRWRGAVASGIRGKRGQAFLRELATAMDAMENKRLIRDELQEDGEVCALGVVAKARGMDFSRLDTWDYETLSAAFGISEALAREIIFVNDDYGFRPDPWCRWRLVRGWINENLIRHKLTEGINR